jgi:hypothetical protein
MKLGRIIQFALIAVAVAVTAVIPSHASPIQCSTIVSPVLSDFLTGGADVAGCEVSDEIFTNFTYTGSAPASQVLVSFNVNGPIPAGTSVQFGDAEEWTATTTLGFTTTVDTTVCAKCVIVATLDQIFTPPTPISTYGSFTHTLGVSPFTVFGSVNLNGLAPSNLSGQVSIPGVTSVATSFTETAGTQLQEVSTTFSESDMPEPATMATVGGLLIGLAALARKRRA